MKMTFFIKHVNGTNANKNSFSPQNEPQTANVSLEVFWSFLARNCEKILI